MAEKKICPICDANTSSLFRTGICPNGCNGHHAYVEGGPFGEFCKRCEARAEHLVHQLDTTPKDASNDSRSS